uniref:WIYLD domain-containing protein n=3 Tax=Triticinae TaxID=1648030 RepID=A0A453T4R3_AEGTS
QPEEAAMLDSPLENIMPILMVLIDDEEETQLGLQQDNENEEAHQQEAEMMEEPLEDFIPIAIVPPSEAVLAVEQTEEVVPMLVDPPSPRAASPDLASAGSKRTRRPSYGWISDSESDSDYEEYLAH